MGVKVTKKHNNKVVVITTKIIQFKKKTQGRCLKKKRLSMVQNQFLQFLYSLKIICKM